MPRADSTPLVNAVLLALGSRTDLTVWRNNSGALEAPSGRFVAFGLTGSSDILGFADPKAHLLAIECKAGLGRLSPTQRAFRDVVETRGGLFVQANLRSTLEESVALVVETVDLYLAVVRRG